MTYPEGPLWILGIPYTVKFVSLPDPDNIRCDRMIDRDAGELRLVEGVPDASVHRSVFWLIIREAIQLLPSDKECDWRAEDAFANLYRGMLKTNPVVLAFCAGWSDEFPRSVNISGIEWSISPVDHCPGYDKSTFGLTTYLNQSIYVRGEMPAPVQRSILMHELGHAVADTGAAIFREDEAFLRAIQTTIGAVLRDNPDYTKALFGYRDQPKE